MSLYEWDVVIIKNPRKNYYFGVVIPSELRDVYAHVCNLDDFKQVAVCSNIDNEKFYSLLGRETVNEQIGIDMLQEFVKVLNDGFTFSIQEDLERLIEVI